MCSQIKIKTLTGRTQDYNFEETTEVKEVKQALQEKEGIQVEQIRLIFSGKQLADDKLPSKRLHVPPHHQKARCFTDDTVHPPRILLQTDGTPSGPPIGNTQFLLGVDFDMRALLLNDAPEHGVCKPE